MTRWPGRLVLLGYQIGYSRSPRFQNAALKAAGIPLTYELSDVPPSALDAEVSALRTVGGAGNVTKPHKARVAELCDDLTTTASRAGAVNTFWCRDGRLIGDNTDVGGFTAAVATLLGREPSDLTVAVLGSGGAAAGALTAIEAWPRSRSLVLGRTASRASALAARFRSSAQAIDDDGEIAAAQLVVNATPRGLHDDEYPLDPGRFPEGAAVLDMVYRAGETAWVRAARARGHAAADGLRMLVEQGALAFERWFGVAPDREVMWRGAQQD